MAAEKRRTLHTKLILDVSLAFAVVVLLYIVVNFYYERKLTSDALTAKFRGDVVARLQSFRAQIEQIADERERIARLQQLCGGEFARMVAFAAEWDHVLAAYDANASLIVASAGEDRLSILDQSLVYETISKKIAQDTIADTESGKFIVAICPLLAARNVEEGEESDEGSPAKVVGALAYIARPAGNKVLSGRLTLKLMLNRLVGFAVILAVLVVVISKVTRHLILAPLEQFILHQHAAARGDLRRYEGARPNNEIGDLFTMFDRVLQSLAEKEKTLKRLKKRTETELPLDELESIEEDRPPAQDEDFMFEEKDPRLE